jgi:hypothetical protein
MTRWQRLVKQLDYIFLLFGFMCSALFFVLLYGLFLDMVQEVSKENSWAFTVASYVMVITYYYWVARGLCYLIKSSKANKRWE